MVPQIHWEKNRWTPWLAAGMALVAVFDLFVMWQDRGQGARAWVPDLWVLIFLPFISRGFTRPLYVLGEGVLAVASRVGGRRQPGMADTRWVPLAAAEFKPIGQGWYLRWREGGRYEAEHLQVPSDFAAAVAAAVAAAGEGAAVHPSRAPELLPLGEVERPWLQWGAALVCLPLLALAIWLNQPLLLAPVLALFPLALLLPEQRCLLYGDTLLLLTPGRAPERLALAGVDALQVTARGARLRTRGARPRTLFLRGLAVITALQRRLG